MEKKHTPGPWEVRKHGNGASEIYSTPEAGSFPVICCLGDDLPGLRYGGSGRDNASNVALIAAAPDLLEALEGLYGFNRLLCIDPLANGDNCYSCPHCKARQAIAKAKGE